jgi:hypothetical protein
VALEHGDGPRGRQLGVARAGHQPRQQARLDDEIVKSAGRCRRAALLGARTPRERATEQREDHPNSAESPPIHTAQSTPPAFCRGSSMGRPRARAEVQLRQPTGEIGACSETSGAAGPAHARTKVGARVRQAVAPWAGRGRRTSRPTFDGCPVAGTRRDQDQASRTRAGVRRGFARWYRPASDKRASLPRTARGIPARLARVHSRIRGWRIRHRHVLSAIDSVHNVRGAKVIHTMHGDRIDWHCTGCSLPCDTPGIGRIAVIFRPSAADHPAKADP